MVQKSIKLRTSFQFDGIEKKSKLLSRIKPGSRDWSRFELGQRSRAMEAYLAWIRFPQQEKRIIRYLQKQQKGYTSKPEDLPLERVARALQIVGDAARRRSGFSALLLRRVNALLDLSFTGPESEYRKEQADPEFQGHRPFRPYLISGAVDRSIEWFESEGAQQLHAIERTVLCLARLTEIWPFDRVNLPSLMMGASYYLVVAEFPDPAVNFSERGVLAQALQSAGEISMQQLVDLYVRIQSDTLDKLESLL